MTDPGGALRGGLAGCAVLPASAVVSYADGGLAGADAWSVEAHLPGCLVCRRVLAGCSDASQLSQNRAILLTRVGLAEPGPLGRELRRWGVPEHVRVLLAATPSLRRSWLAGVLLVLALAVSASQLAATRYMSGAGAPGLAGPDGWRVLIPFLVIVPLVPVAAVACTFSPALDRASVLVTVAPVSKVWLLCVRSLAIVAATLVPAALAALALPGPGWLAAALLLPALAVCAVALALATVLRPDWAAIAAGAGWITLVTGLGVLAPRPALIVGLGGQLTALAVLMAAVALFATRRNKIDYGWMG
jgi:hypothetical protein